MPWFLTARLYARAPSTRQRPENDEIAARAHVQVVDAPQAEAVALEVLEPAVRVVAAAREDLREIADRQTRRPACSVSSPS